MRQAHQHWVVSVRYAPADRPDFERHAVVGRACASTVEAVLHLAQVPEETRAEIRAHQTVRDFVDGKLDPGATGYYAPNPMPASSAWLVCIGAVHEVLRG